jgi:hypothetical protein
MKRLILIILTTAALSGCYDDYRMDYDYSSVAFADVRGGLNSAGVLGRTVVKDEGLKLEIGVYLGGVIQNDEEKWVEFEIDPTLLTGTTYQMMPENYYSLSNENRFVIPAGSHLGKTTIYLDSVQFLNDANATLFKYAIPFRLKQKSGNIDSVLQEMDTKILVIKYINHLDGNFIQKGSYETFAAGGNLINNGLIDNIIAASTVMLDTIDTSGMIYTGSEFKMRLIPNQNNSVYIKYVPPSSLPQPSPIPERAEILKVTDNGSSTYDRSKCAFTLNYRIDYKNGNYSIIQSELLWRNRIRDGINEWVR